MFGKPSADCLRCRRDPTLRTELGCDAPAPLPVWRSSCPCGGVPDCTDCEGSGVRRWFRCPGSIIAARPDINRLFDAWSQYERRHALPAPGAWLDQTAAFAQSCALIDVERLYWDEEQEKERDRARRQHAARGRK